MQNRSVKYFSLIACFSIILIFGFFEWISIPLKVSYADAAFYFYQLIVEKTFFTPHNRYLAICIEWLPLIGVWLNLSFKTVFNLFGLNSYISSVLIISFYYYLTRNNSGLWILVLSLFIGTVHSYFYLVPEHFGYTFVLFLFLIMDYFISNNSKLLYPFMIVCLVILYGSHLYAVLLFLIAMLYVLFENKNRRVKVIVWLTTFLGIFLLLKLCASIDGYEQSKIDVLKYNFMHLSELDNSAYRYYVDLNHPKKWILYLFLFLNYGLSLFYKRFWYFVFSVICFIALYYINCLYFVEWASNAYMDLYGRICALSTLPFLYYLLKRDNNRYIILPLACILFTVYTLFSIKNINSDYERRVQKILNWTTSMEPKKVSRLYIHRSMVPFDSLMLDWAIAYESMAVSTLNQGSTKTICTGDETTDIVSDWDPHYFTTGLGIEEYSKLKNTYYGSLKKGKYVYK